MKITKTTTFKMVNDEAKELSSKLLNKMYVIQRGNVLITSTQKENGIILSIWECGNNLI